MAAAHLLRLVRDPAAQIEITAPTERRIPGLITHRARNVTLHLTEARGIPVTTPAWTLLDIAARLEDEALAWYRVGPAAVARVLDARGGAVKGCRRLMRILDGDDPLLLSRWPHLGLIVELDSYRFHGSRRAWERDRERDRAARRRGEDLIRYTADDVFKRGVEVRAQMRARIPRLGGFAGKRS